jgi:hypothetical protein
MADKLNQTIFFRELIVKRRRASINSQNRNEALVNFLVGINEENGNSVKKITNESLFLALRDAIEAINIS